MDVNSIQNGINNLNNVQQNNLGQTSGASKTGEVTNDEALNLTISQVYQKQRDELSQSLQNLNEGIAVTEIGKQGLQKQEAALQNIQKELYSVINSDNINKTPTNIKDDLAQHLRDFNEIADNTTFKNQPILSKTETSEEFTISTKEDTYSIEPADTKAVSSELIQNIHNNPFVTKGDLNNAVKDVQTAVGKTNENYQRFDDLQTKIEDNARNTITDQINLSKDNSKRLIDFGAQMEDFSKTNISANSGYLVGSQANIVQEQSVRLISK